MWPSNLMDDLEKKGTSSVLHQAFQTHWWVQTAVTVQKPFQTHWWIQTAVTVQKPSIWVKIGDFLSCVTLKFDGWPWQTIGHLFYATSSFVNHFKAIGEFKLEWQSGNTHFRSKSLIFVPCDLEISRMTLKNNRAPLLCYFNLYASFHSHLWIQTRDTVRKHAIWVEIDDFLAVWPWNLTDDLENQ